MGYFFTQPTSPPAGAHLVLYDGVCGLCSRLVQFLLRRDRRRLFSFASLQSPVGQSVVERAGADSRELTSFYVVADYQTGASRVFSKSDAALFVAGALGWPWTAAGWLRPLPQRIRDWGYDAVAKHRYHVFGRHDQCVVPCPEFRGRFLDR